MWLPQKEVLIEIGLVNEAFPALTTMRGSGQRNPLDYINSLKTCRSLNADYLVALHGPNPVTAGEENVRQYLTNFSDAIQFMHDQTVQYMNRGYTPGEIEELLALPPHLASSPYLQETYGSMEWDVHHIFRYYRGYYTGEIRDLFPQSALSEARMSAELAGGVAELASKAEDARVNGNLEWALRLADDVLILDPGHPTALETKKAAMLALAEGTMNSQARNMLLSEYLLLTGQVPAQFPFGDPQAIFSRMGENAVLLMPLETAHRILAVNLNASKSIAMNVSMDIRFTDIKKNDPTEADRHTLQVRNGVLEVDPPSTPASDLVVNTTSLIWKNLVLGKLAPDAAVAAGDVVVSGGTPGNFYAFMDLFRLGGVADERRSGTKEPLPLGPGVDGHSRRHHDVVVVRHRVRVRDAHERGGELVPVGDPGRRPLHHLVEVRAAVGRRIEPLVVPVDRLVQRPGLREHDDDGSRVPPQL